MLVDFSGFEGPLVGRPIFELVKSEMCVSPSPEVFETETPVSGAGSSCTVLFPGSSSLFMVVILVTDRDGTG